MTTANEIKPVSKMTKKELLKELDDCGRQINDYVQASTASATYRDNQALKMEKIKEEKADAITGIEIWKSACFEAQERVQVLEARINVMRDVVQNMIVQTKYLPEEEHEGLHNKIIRLVARKLIDLEGTLKPFIQHFLPMPKVLQGIIKYKAELDAELRNAYGEDRVSIVSDILKERKPFQTPPETLTPNA